MAWVPLDEVTQLGSCYVARPFKARCHCSQNHISHPRLTMITLRAIVPEKITNTVIRFCSMVSPRQQPVYVPVKPESYSLPSECFPNVENKTSHDGGSIAYGWKIWLYPDFFIEAEFHSIWKSPEGAYIDITQDNPPISKILFIPDGKKKFTGYRVDNIRYNFSGNQLVDIYIEIAKCIYLITTHNSEPYAYATNLKGVELELMKEMAPWGIKIESMLRNGISRNASCPCGSDIKFKSCCGKQLLKLIENIKKYYNLK